MDTFKLFTAQDEVNKEYQKPELVDLKKTKETAASYGSCAGYTSCGNGSGNTSNCNAGTGVGP